MTWEVVAGIATLVGFIITIIKTVIPLTNAITKLTDKLENLDEKVDDINESKTKAHKALWDYNYKQDKVLQEHTMRLHDLDGKGGVQ